MTYPRLAATEDALQTYKTSFSLSAQDLALVNAIRGGPRRLARALLLVWARSKQAVAASPAELPEPILTMITSQLGLSPAVLAQYKNKPTLHTADVRAVQDYLHLHPFTPEAAHQLREYLSTQIKQTGDTSSLLEAADDWITRQGIMRPIGRTALERIVYRVRPEAERELFESVANQLTQAQRDQLDALCQTNQGKSPLANLAAEPRVISSKTICDECHRLTVIRAVTPDPIDWKLVRPPRISQWAAIVRRLPAQALRRYPPAKRYTLLLAFLSVRRQEITDAIVEMFDTLIGHVFAQVTLDQRAVITNQAQATRTSARIFRKIALVLLDSRVPSPSVRDEIFQRLPRNRVRALTEQSQSLEEDEIDLFFALLKGRYAWVRTFSRAVLQTLHFDAPRPKDSVLKAIDVLRMMEREHRKKVPKDAPLDFVPQRWLRAVVQSDGVNRRAWELSLLFQIRQALRSGDLTVEGSYRYASWDAHLYKPDCWKQQRGFWFARSSLPQDGAAYLTQTKADLHTLTMKAAQHASENTLFQVSDNKLRLREREQTQMPPATASVRRSLISLLPRIGLPQLLLEVDSWTRFTSAFAHLSARRRPTLDQMGALRPTLFAVLVAEATNVGLTTMAASSGIPYAQLMRVYDWYVREETLQQAIRILIAQYQRLPLSSIFGSGTTSASSALRLGATDSGPPILHDQSSADTRRGVTLYNHVSNQGVQFWTSVVNPLAGDAAYILDGLVLQDFLPVDEHTMKTPGCTDLLFGAAHLLGYQLEPDPHSLLSQPLSRAREAASYGPLAPILQNPIRDSLITSQWDEMNRLVASLKDKLVAPSLIIPKLEMMGGNALLVEAFQEVGRIARTHYILNYLEDVSLRQRMLTDQNKAISLHALAQAVFFGRQGYFTDRGYEANHTRALILSLVLNAIIVWNTFYLEAAFATLAKRGQPVSESIWPHLSPILWEHLHMTGDYHFGNEFLA